ncbi:MarR family winged helix-turn-helix transcriptional regulator [Streptomyces deccanensis]|uniref:MarR family winged helix-turn-helix transcriptional regulator n=1 Tax=Streptomyces deccanensis TaxID=424188 RepID=UPI001EFB1715|nr:MarR family transcriptional regulator [Streptomyces deccanensis]ULR48544.1 MarR family transcriptional regulator [Streptomyces deccanensis]
MGSEHNTEHVMTDRDVSGEEIARAADALFAAMRRARSAGAERIGGLSLAQVALLEPLATETDIPVGHLASSADVSVPTATRMLQQLERKGIVVRRRSPEDERRVLVGLTPEGAEVLATLRSRLRERQLRAYEAFTPAERTQLVSLLRRLTGLVSDTDSD